MKKNTGLYIAIGVLALIILILLFSSGSDSISKKIYKNLNKKFWNVYEDEQINLAIAYPNSFSYENLENSTVFSDSQTPEFYYTFDLIASYVYGSYSELRDAYMLSFLAYSPTTNEGALILEEGKRELLFFEVDYVYEEIGYRNIFYIGKDKDNYYVLQFIVEKEKYNDYKITIDDIVENWYFGDVENILTLNEDMSDFISLENNYTPVNNTNTNTQTYTSEWEVYSDPNFDFEVGYNTEKGYDYIVDDGAVIFSNNQNDSCYYVSEVVLTKSNGGDFETLKEISNDYINQLKEIDSSAHNPAGLLGMGISKSSGDFGSFKVKYSIEGEEYSNHFSIGRDDSYFYVLQFVCSKEAEDSLYSKWGNNIPTIVSTMHWKYGDGIGRYTINPDTKEFIRSGGNYAPSEEEGNSSSLDRIDISASSGFFTEGSYTDFSSISSSGLVLGDSYTTYANYNFEADSGKYYLYVFSKNTIFDPEDPFYYDYDLDENPINFIVNSNTNNLETFEVVPSNDTTYTWKLVGQFDLVEGENILSISKSYNTVYAFNAEEFIFSKEEISP